MYERLGDGIIGTVGAIAMFAAIAGAIVGVVVWEIGRWLLRNVDVSVSW